MDSVLEQQRALHEERERLTDAIVEEALLKRPTRREKINSDHRVHDFYERYQSGTVQLNRLYVDKTGQRNETMEKLKNNQIWFREPNLNSKVPTFSQKHDAWRRPSCTAL